MRFRINGRNAIGLLGIFILLDSVQGRTPGTEELPTDLEDFVVYAEPRVIDGLRQRPFTRRDPVVEELFNAFPGITESVYQENLLTMQTYLDRCKRDKTEKMERLAELAGLTAPPDGLVEGYEERIHMLETVMSWIKKEKPIQLVQLNIWHESDLRYRLARIPVENIRINPETNELESRLRFNWQMLFENRSRAIDLKLEFDMGIHLQKQTGYYNPSGFLHWNGLRSKHLKVFEVTYPVILTDALRQDSPQELFAYKSAYRTTINSFYHILREFFFSDLADLHTLYILARGRIFADEWRQYQSTPLQRGLAAHLVFQTLEEQIGKARLQEILDNDWTTWHPRKIGTEFNPLTWDNERTPYPLKLSYKDKPNLRNIYWSTRFVHYLLEQYGPTFVRDLCRVLMSQGSPQAIKKSEADLFKDVTGDDLLAVIGRFSDQESHH